MRTTVYCILCSLLLSFLGLSLSSFALVSPPVERSAKDQRLQKQQQRLRHRLNRASSVQQRVRIERRLQRMGHQSPQQTERRLTLGAAALLCGVAAMILLSVSFLTSFMAVGSPIAATMVGIGFVLTFLFVILGFVLSIMALRATKNDPERVNERRLALAGLVISIIVFVPVLLSFLSFFALI